MFQEYSAHGLGFECGAMNSKAYLLSNLTFKVQISQNFIDFTFFIVMWNEKNHSCSEFLHFWITRYNFFQRILIDMI